MKFDDDDLEITAVSLTGLSGGVDDIIRIVGNLEEQASRTNTDERREGCSINSAYLCR